MAQPWHRWREPLAVTLLVVLALTVVLRGVAFGLAIEGGTSGGMLGSIPGGDALLLLTTAGAVLWCATPITGAVGEAPALSAHAWPITVAGAVIVGLTVFGFLALAVWDVVALATWPTPDLGFVLLVLEELLRLAVPAASLVAVVLAVRRAAAARSVSLTAPAVEAPAAPIEEDVPAVEAPPERLPAAWQADEATGAVWLTADDAAQGRPGLSWSDPAAPPADASSAAAPPVASEDDDLR